MIITSFSRDGYNQYGKRFLDTWNEHVGKPITVYSEDKLDIPYKDMGEIPGFNAFVASTQFDSMKGKIWGQGYNYRHNVHKFCRKSFAQIDAAANQQNGVLYWIDSDVEISGNLFEVIPPFKDAFMMYLGRPEWHSCASFVGWNLDHQISDKFWETYWKIYLTGTVFFLPEWHDSFILDWLRDQLKIPAIDLANGSYLEGPANVFDHVFGKYAHHKKGNLKAFQNRYEELLAAVREERPKKILEVGTWNGRRAAEMCKEVDASYLGFDLFEDATEETDSEEKNVKQHCSKDEVHRYLNSEGVRHCLVKGNTRETMAAYPLDPREEYRADFAFIDGGHSVETIRSDWENVKRLMRPGGLVIFDDYYEGDIDTSKFGANEIVKDLDYDLGSVADPVQGGGSTRLAYVRV